MIVLNKFIKWGDFPPDSLEDRIGYIIGSIKEKDYDRETLVDDLKAKFLLLQNEGIISQSDVIIKRKDESISLTFSFIVNEEKKEFVMTKDNWNVTFH